MNTNPAIPSHGRSYIRAWRALLILFVVGLIVSSYADFGLNGRAISARALGEVTGGALFLAGLPALVIVPWRFAQRRRVTTDAPIIVGGVIFVILTILVLTGATIDSP